MVRFVFMVKKKNVVIFVGIYHEIFFVNGERFCDIMLTLGDKSWRFSVNAS